MFKPNRKIYSFYILMDLLFIGVSFLLSYLLRYLGSIFQDSAAINPRQYFSFFMLWTVFILLVFSLRGLYHTDRSLTIPEEAFKTVTNILYVSILMSAVIFLTQYKFFSRLVFLLSFIFLCFFLSAWRITKRIILRRLIAEGFHNLNILIVGAGSSGIEVLGEIKRNPWWGFRVIGFLGEDVKKTVDGAAVLGAYRDFPRVVKKYFIDEVIITSPFDKEDISDLIKQAKELHVGIRLVPENLEEPPLVSNINYLGIIPLLTYKERRRHPSELALKRIFDLTISMILLLLLSPAFLVTMILIKFDSKGPLFFVQKRVGFKGRVFNLYKFRSMVEEAESLKPALLPKNEIKDGVIFKIKDDPRVTPIGKFLRKYSLDELPQLFNVFIGDMSLVGTRPPMIDEVDKYTHDHMQRLVVRPGLTGLSQVRGRSELTFRNWVRWDMWYINNWSFWLDMKILWWTIPVVLKGKGAY